MKEIIGLIATFEKVLHHGDAEQEVGLLMSKCPIVSTLLAQPVGDGAEVSWERGRGSQSHSN